MSRRSYHRENHNDDYDDYDDSRYNGKRPVHLREKKYFPEKTHKHREDYNQVFDDYDDDDRR